MKTHHFYVGKETGHVTWSIKFETGSLMFLGQILYGNRSYQEVKNSGKLFIDKWNTGEFNPDNLDIDGYYMSELIRPCEYRHKYLGTFDNSHYKEYHYSFMIAPLSDDLYEHFNIVSVDNIKPIKDCWTRYCPSKPCFTNDCFDHGLFIQLFDVLDNTNNVYVKKLIYKDLEYFIFHRSHKDFEFNILNLTLRFL